MAAAQGAATGGSSTTTTKSATPSEPKPKPAATEVAQQTPAAAPTKEAKTTAAGDADEQAEEPEKNLPPHPFQQRIPAPELEGGVAWINTAGPVELRQLRGKFVLLDFWTYCCINCMHVLPELKKLEKKYPNELVVIGVHSAKFDEEKDSQNITDAAMRYEIEHPIVNDANHAIWNRYGVNSWPTMLLIDPEGNAVYMRGGEVPFETLDALLASALPYYKAKKSLDPTPLRFDLAAYKAEKTPLRYPGKVIADEASQRLFIADSNHNRLVVSSLTGELIETIGSGKIGAADGAYAAASFNKPQGMFLHGETLYVCDTENHLLRKVDLKAKQVTTLAGVGKQAKNPWPGLDKLDLRNFDEAKLPSRWVGKPKETALNSPWDVWVKDKDLYIAMAGPHQIWKMPLDESEIGPYAGNGREDIVDGPLLPKEPYAAGFASFAQPSGLTSDGKLLYVADSEGSSIRAVPFDPKLETTTPLGTSHLQYGRLFDFGDVDGDAMTAKFQHLLGVAFYEGKLYVTDTYNNKIKVVDLQKVRSDTLVGSGKPGLKDNPPQFDEPAGISAAAGKLYIADTNNHAIRVVDLRQANKVTTLTISGLTAPVIEAETPSPLAGAKEITVAEVKAKAKPGKSGDAVSLDVALTLPKGWKINPLAPMRYTVTAEADGPVDRKQIGKSVKLDEPAAKFTVELPVVSKSGSDKVKVALNYYYCQEGAEGVCKVGTVVWTVPLTLVDDDSAKPAPLELKVE